MRTRFVLSVVALALAAAGVSGQEVEGRDQRQHGEPDVSTQSQRAWDFWLKGQGQLYENFFQAPDGADEEDVSALYGEIGASLRVAGPVRAYAAVNTLRFDDEELGDSPGVRLGLRSEGRPHSFDVYLEQLNDRPSFDVGDEFDRADIRSAAGEWSWRFHDDWQVSFDGELQQQEFEITENRDNDYRSLGAALRWRASRLFSPEIGFRAGERDVDDETQSYDQNEVYLQVRSSITPALYLSLRLRDRQRDYSTGVPASSNFGRDDSRRQLALSAVYSITPHLSIDAYAARENVDSNVTGRDFDTTLLVGGLTWKY